MPWVMLLVIAVMAFLFYTLVYVSVNAQLEAVKAGTIPEPRGGTAQFTQTLQQLRPAGVARFGMSIVMQLGAVMLIVLAASHVGSEYGWGTLRTLLAHGAGRGAFLAAKLASLVLYAAVFMVVGTICVVAASYLISAITGLGTEPGVDLGGVAATASRGLYTFLPYMALAAVIAVLSRSGGAGIATGLVVYFAEALVSGIISALDRDLAKVFDFGLSRNVQALQRVQSGPETGPAAAAAASLPDATQAALVLAAYTIVFVGLAYWRLRSRDVTLS